MFVNDPKQWINSKLSWYIEKIIEFNDKIGESRGTHKRFSKITSFLIIFGKLTQKQLKILTNYSLSNLSNSLNTLVETRLIKKNRITGTHTYEYSLAISIVDTNRIIIGILNQNLKNGVNFLSVIKNELKDLSHLNLSGNEIITNQVNYLIEDFNNYNKILDTIIKFLNSVDDEYEPEIDYAFQLKAGNYKLYKEVSFDKRLLIIENRIADYLQETIFQARNSQSKALDLTILAYFCTRGMLTQNQIKKITKLSVGAISQALKVLDKRNLVEVSPLERNKDGKQLPRIYRMRSLSLAGINRIHSLFGTIIKSKTTFQEMKANLKENTGELENLKGYSEIREFIDNLLRITPKYENIINFFVN